MSSIRRHARLLVLAVCCVALGAGISAIASAGAATAGRSAGAATAGHAGKHRLAALRRFERRAVHGQITVATKTGYATVTFDRGKVASVSGQQLTITEGARTTHPRTVTLTIPANAVVRDNRHQATLSALTAGQRVLVLVAPKHTYVIAHTARTA